MEHMSVYLLRCENSDIQRRDIDDMIYGSAEPVPSER